MRLIHVLAGALMAAAPPPPARWIDPQAAKPMTWADLTGRPRPVPDATIAYGADAMQRIDLWLPAGPGPYPVALMIHGGCWTTAIADRRLMDWAAADLRAHGIAVWNIDYRGVDRAGGGYPGTFLDVAAAADRLATEAARYRLDLDRMVAIGHSAGGHLALWLAGRAKLPADNALRGADPLPVRDVIGLGGLPDLEATAAAPDNGCGTAVVAKLVGAATPSHPDIYADTSPVRLLPLGARQALIDGADDRIVPRRLTEGYLARARAAGDAVTLTVVPASGHVELIAPGTAAWAEARARVVAMLAR